VSTPVAAGADIGVQGAATAKPPLDAAVAWCIAATRRQQQGELLETVGRNAHSAREAR
jgi:hypothetical protein